MEKILNTKNGMLILSDTDQSQTIELMLLGVWEDHILDVILKSERQNP